MNLTLAEENYIKAIYSIMTEDAAITAVSTNSLADKMQTRASSVTDMVKRLSEKKLVKYERYQGVTLTKKGQESAIATIRKHRLWEVFLVEKLRFGWDEVHEIAEQLEHIQSTVLTDRLDDFLGNPKFDPHGDPIPDKKGNIPVQHAVIPLSDAKAKDKVVITGVSDSSSKFLKYLLDCDLTLGEELEIIDVIEFDQSMIIKQKGKKESLMLSNLATGQIIVQRKK